LVPFIWVDLPVIVIVSVLDHLGQLISIAGYTEILEELIELSHVEFARFVYIAFVKDLPIDRSRSCE